MNALNEARDEMVARETRVRELGDDPRHLEAGAGFGRSRRRDQPAAGFNGALRTLERHVDDGRLSSEAVDRVDEVLRGDDADLGLDARYIESAGTAAYETAFSKLLQYGDGAVLRMTGEEQTAVQQTNRASETRALVEGTGSAGGFAVPISIDPTVTLSSNGAINPSGSSPTCGRCRPRAPARRVRRRHRPVSEGSRGGRR